MWRNSGPCGTCTWARCRRTALQRLDGDPGPPVADLGSLRRQRQAAPRPPVRLNICPKSCSCNGSADHYLDRLPEPAGISLVQHDLDRRMTSGLEWIVSGDGRSNLPATGQAPSVQLAVGHAVEWHEPGLPSFQVDIPHTYATRE